MTNYVALLDVRLACDTPGGKSDTPGGTILQRLACDIPGGKSNTPNGTVLRGLACDTPGSTRQNKI